MDCRICGNSLYFMLGKGLKMTPDGFSPYFSFAELTYTSHSDLLSKNRIDAKQYRLAGKRLSKLLESIRHILGDKPLKISSGYRNEALNKAVGSLAKSSSHMRFEAADIVPNMSLKEAFTAIMNAQRGGLLPDLRKAIREDHKGIIHVDVKMSDKEVFAAYTTDDNVDFKLA